MRFEERFEFVVTEVRAYYFNIVKKLEDVFDNIILENMYWFPQAMLEMMEEDSGVEWDDQIWEAVYNDTPCNKILKMIEDKRKEEENCLDD